MNKDIYIYKETFAPRRLSINPHNTACCCCCCCSWWWCWWWCHAVQYGSVDKHWTVGSDIAHTYLYNTARSCSSLCSGESPDYSRHSAGSAFINYFSRCRCTYMICIGWGSMSVLSHLGSLPIDMLHLLVLLMLMMMMMMMIVINCSAHRRKWQEHTSTLFDHT